MECELCGSTTPSELGDDGLYCVDCGCRIDAMDPRLGIDYRTLNPSEPLGSNFSPTSFDERRRHRHQVQSTKEVREDWIRPIRDELMRRFPNVVADRAYELIRGANRKKMLSTIRKKLKGHEKITGKAERSDYRRTLWAIAAVEVMSEMEGCDYGTDKIFLELKIPSFDRNWAVRYLRPRRAHSAMGAEDTRREVLRNTLERSRQIRNWLNASEANLRKLFPPELCSEVMDIACNLLRDEWMQPLHEGDFYGIHPFSSHPPRRVASRAVLEAMRLQGNFERKDRIAFWEAFPSKGITPDSIR